MTRTRQRIRILLLSAMCLSQGCESFYRPIIRNSGAYPILVEVVTPEKTWRLERFRPGAAFWWREEGVQVTQIRIYKNSELLAEADAAELAEERERAGEDFIGWNFDGSGIRGITMERLLELRGVTRNKATAK